MFIKQGVNPFTKAPFDLFNWAALEPYVHYVSTGVSIARSTQQRVSRIGGEPEFVDVWPRGPHGSLPFICQLDLKELSQGANDRPWPGLPRAGVVSLFFDGSSVDYCSQPSNFAVIFDDAGPKQAVQGEPASKSYRRAWLRPTSKISSKAPRHRIGGEPLWIQAPHAADGYFRSGAYLRDPEILDVLHGAGAAPDAFRGSYVQLVAAGSQLDASGVDSAQLGRSLEHWTLLFQIDADPSIGMELGDLGRLYVFGDPRSFGPDTTPFAWVEYQYH